jgi:AcrR family transcriptional regulator
MSGRKRGPKPALTVEQIARAAIEIADAEGLAAVSMQRVTASLGFTKMAVYRYVSSRAELIAQMIEAAADAPPELRPGPWRDGLKRWAAALLEVFTRHPWLLEATVGPRKVGPRELAWLERAVHALEATALSGPERLGVAVTLTGHIRMIAEQSRGTTEIAPRGDEFPALAAATHAPTDPDPAPGRAAATATHPATGRAAATAAHPAAATGAATATHPAAASATATAADPATNPAADTAADTVAATHTETAANGEGVEQDAQRGRAGEVGLECILDGIEAMHEKRSARRLGRKPPGGAGSLDATGPGKS